MLPHDMGFHCIYCFKKTKTLLFVHALCIQQHKGSFMNEKNENQFKMTDFDYLTADPRLQMLKAAIPYLPVAQQRVFSLFVKVQEVKRAQSIFEEEEVSAMGLSPSAPKPTTPMQLLQIIKPYASPKEREMIEMLENFQIIKEVL